MKEFFTAIQELFETVLFVPFNMLREIELDNWWFANIVTWVFLAILVVSVTYWMFQLKAFSDNNEEDKTISSHSFL
ncbi:MAG: uracil phosphoribosyltransferase [Formosa sp.]|nr:uracil phosphoribosyltransferase [Formosa sp.]|tara:strand:+ start:8378 stop:8605 length:228 start_codon:yes stop_codon:yes gene_type:complete